MKSKRRSIRAKTDNEVVEAVRKNDHKKNTTGGSGIGGAGRNLCVYCHDDYSSPDCEQVVKKPIEHHDHLSFYVEINRWVDECADSQCIAMFAIEFDDYALIQDVLGGEISANLLTHFTDCLDRAGPASAMYSVLHSGRIFVAIPDIQNAESVWKKSNELQSLLASPVALPLGSIDLNPLIGVSMYPLIADNAELLVNTAVAALAIAKTDKRENVCLYDTVKANKQKHTLIRLFELKNALAAGREIETFYQPKQALADDTIVGLEALVRWRHPVDGLLTPAEFIDLAEEKGVICQITDCVIETVCRDFQTLRALGFNGVISVNISARDFDRSDLVSELCRATRAYKVPPQNIELEITETAFIHDFNRCYLVLSALKAKGFKLTIDDFGKGYSSLSYLKKLPVDTIKVDKAFICDIERSKEVQSVFEALLKIAHTQQLKVVAEGVETEAQKRILKRMKCDHIQGYLLSRPRPLDAFINRGGWGSSA